MRDGDAASSSSRDDDDDATRARADALLDDADAARGDGRRRSIETLSARRARCGSARGARWNRATTTTTRASDARETRRRWRRRRRSGANCRRTRRARRGRSRRCCGSRSTAASVGGSDGTRVASARALARAHGARDVDEDEALTTAALYRSGDALLGWATASNFGSGLVAGLGGLLTLPITIPAQLAATTFTSLRLALALAILAGKDPLEPSVAAKAIVAALGSAGSASEALDDVASVGAGVRDGVQYAALRASGAAMQNASWRLTRAAATKLAQRGAQRGASMAITRAVPIIGGVIGGTVDGVMTQSAGKRAMEAFFPPRPKDCSTIEHEHSQEQRRGGGQREERG